MKTVAVAIMGELQRVDESTTIAERVVKPYREHRVVVFMTLQAKRSHVPVEWHRERFANLPSFDDAGERERARTISHRFLAAGASRVVVYVYNLQKLPPLMPTTQGEVSHRHSQRIQQTLDSAQQTPGAQRQYDRQHPR